MRLDRIFSRLFLLVAVLALPRPALADRPITVGDGTAASCTEMALKDALIIAETVGGATIRFHCGSGPVTIALSEPTDMLGLPVMLVLPNNTTINGGGLITLDGTHTATVAFVDRDTTVVLKRLSIIHGVSANGGGGIFNFGTLTVDHSTLSFNTAGTVGGGIENFGTLTVDHSTFSGNSALIGWGGGIAGGDITVDHSTFSENRAQLGGGIYTGGTLTVDHSAFSDNSAWLGGGVFTGASGLLTHSTFSGNDAAWGGGIFNEGTLTVDHSTLSANAAPSGQGGGIFNADTLAVNRSTITHNIAGAGGGIYVCVEGQVLPPFFFSPCHGPLPLQRTIVTENTPDDIFP